MKTKELLGMLSVATATASLTIAICGSGGLDAGDPNTTPPTQIRKPTLVSHGIEVSARTSADHHPTGGQPPAVELVATNPTNQPATATIHISMDGISSRDMMSRLPRMPQSLWNGTKIVSIKAGETITVPLDIPTNLPPNSMVSVVLRGDDANRPATTNQAVLPLQQGVLALSFNTTTTPVVQTASAN